jgi:predicted unusual protein kinase regulating ubiquinone biosynthesis (AarF/ABC1/UbiB family)
VDLQAELPAALAAVVDAGLAVVRRAPSAQVMIARSGGIVEPAALPVAFREELFAEIDAAVAATCVPLPFADVEKALKAAWGRPPRKVLDALEPEPLAARPSAVVHRGSLDGSPVAVKVLRPGVDRAVRNDLALLDVLAGPLHAAFPRIDAGAMLREAREQALDEFDLEHEGSTQRRVARAVRGVPGVVLPRPMLDLAALR